MTMFRRAYQVAFVSCLAGLSVAWPQAQDKGPAEAARPEEIDPTRPLSAQQAQDLVQQVVILVDRGRPHEQREEAVQILETQFRHSAALPALRFVAHEEQESPSLRTKAMRALLFVGLAAAVPDMLRLLRSADQRVRSFAWEALRSQHPEGSEFLFDPAKPPAENEEAIARWEQWWKQNEHTFEFDLGPLFFNLY
jgi:hypothetical protein